ncbi:MAG: 4-(cytidine 5'-diphospho)-2-C-methyl-D-erythritol kinase [Gammaproteobacteria bacterium]|nr:4-(cytidine 5'-diphospho)-2-C-methyl-D-erythritol kinase [Gammaproteobacteria bacterium]
MTAPASRGWPAPAKLNLFLHITGRRADGYHLLQTVFQFLDHGDTLDFTPRDDQRIARATGPEQLPAETDLVVRAAQLLQVRTGCRAGADIHLHKRLPLRAGLGGGSSDAATTLVALNHLWNTRLTPAALAQLGLELGADVPVFIYGQAAWAEGVGEILTPVELPEPWFVVVKPPCEVATREIFQAPELTRNSPPITIARFRSGEGGNAFEPVVRKRYPAVAEVLDWLSLQGPARLTGTGACVFVACGREIDARRVLQALPGGWRGFVARGKNRSPLLDRLAAAQAR